MNPYELGALAAVALGLLQIVRVTVNRLLVQQGEQAAERRKAAQTYQEQMIALVSESTGRVASGQEKLADVMDNHMSHIAINQAKTSVALDLVVTRLLDAALPRRRT